MVWPWALPLVLAVPYWVMFAVVWRSLTGHVAWAVHRSAKTNPTVRPPVENWVAAAIPCAMLAVLWPAVLLFIVRWPRSLQKGEERKAEFEIKDLEFKELVASNDRKYDALVAGDVLQGEVER